MNYSTDLSAIEVWTEGKTDWMLLKKAEERLNVNLPIRFHDEKKSMGDKRLRDYCKTFAERKNSTPLVFLFDHDNPDIVKEMSDPNNSYKSWGNNVYSFVIPVPAHRQGYTNVSIEFFFTDDEIKTEDLDGRRLFLTSEFNETSGKLNTDGTINIGNKHVLKKCMRQKDAKIVDSDAQQAGGVHDSNRNIALSKAAFAEYIVNEVPPFNGFDFAAFKPIFDTLSRIARDSRLERSVFIPNLDELVKELETKSDVQQLSTLFDTMKRMMQLALYVFIISSIRFYENEIINEPAVYIKKVKPIKSVLKEKFFSPTLGSVHKLSERCFYLVDKRAPIPLQEMKNCLDEVFGLDAIGQVIDDLELLYPPRRGTVIQTNKSRINRSLMKYVIGEFVKYDSRLLSDIEDEAEPWLENGTLKIEAWKQALLQLERQFQPMFSRPVELRAIKSLDSRTGKYILEKQTYADNAHSIEELQLSAEEAEEYSAHYSHLLLDEGETVHLYPILLVKENALYFYQRSRSSGYEYYSLVNNRIHRENTKKKFNHAVFRTGSTQEFFWTDVIPTINPDSGIRANIPLQGLDGFVGRARQMTTIREEILEIPNLDGIVYGPGGIGKTALMQQITYDMFREIDRERVLFDNIVWVSAKSNYYDPTFATTEPQEQYLRTLAEIVRALLEFFEYEGLDEYDFDDMQLLLLEVLSENRTLLVIDNFETVSKKEAESIIKFFGARVKKHLRFQPDQFKVVITSRKQIPSGFVQIQLKGLDLRESRKLLRRLQDRYRVKPRLNEYQERDIHDASRGIPIVLKHCFGQLTEFNRPLQSVLRELIRYESNIVQFSYGEILREVESNDKSGIRLKVLLLLEYLNYPLMISQIAKVIEVDEQDVEAQLPLLRNFQCLEVVSIEGREKYVLNDEIRLLTKALAQRHAAIGKELRESISTSRVEGELDATADERHLAQMFENYLMEDDLLNAEDFIIEQFSVRPDSLLLNYHYARYQIERRHNYEKAIEILERIRESSGNHPKLLSLIVKCYTSLEIPRYEVAEPYVIELENCVEIDKALTTQIAEFYTDWSSEIKSGIELDPLDEQVRQQSYRRIAKKALEILEPLQGQPQDDRYYYLCAKSYYNAWDNEKALEMILKAIKTADVPDVYDSFRRRILRRMEHFERRRSKR